MLTTLIRALLYLFSVLCAGHALLHKRDPRSALGWIVVCLALPGVGALLYLILGVNLIRVHGRRMGRHWPAALSPEPFRDPFPPSAPPHMRDLERISYAVTERPLLPGNLLTPLHCGDEAYPAMLEAIEGAGRSVRLCTYLFQADETGMRFAGALGAAAARGADVRVLLDGMGELYSLPRTIGPALRRKGVKVARFLPPSLLRPRLHMNLRNHRKILVVDGRVGFTGGMNISERNLGHTPEHRRIVDMHFRVDGPVVAEMERAFLEDWCFVTGQPWEDPGPGPLPMEGGASCRAVSDGPSKDFERLLWILIGALSTARSRVQVMTPYFVPTRELVAAFNTAALRGVDVEILLPARNNLPLVAWASRAMLWQVLERGVKVLLSPPPFAHTKMLVVDGHYALIGSANLDPRSLRLNFEFNLEAYGEEPAQSLGRHFDEVRRVSRPVTLDEMDGRSLPVKLRDGMARLFSPYL